MFYLQQNSTHNSGIRNCRGILYNIINKNIFEIIVSSIIIIITGYMVILLTEELKKEILTNSFRHFFPNQPRNEFLEMLTALGE